MASSTTPTSETNQSDLTQSPNSPVKPTAPGRFRPGRIVFGFLVLLVLGGLGGLALLSATSKDTHSSQVGPTTTPTVEATATISATRSAVAAASTDAVSWSARPVLYGLAANSNSKDYQSLLAGLGSGLRQSTDGGKTWATVADFKGQSVTALAFDQFDPEHAAYLGTDRAGLFKSVDGGKTWKNIGLIGRPINALAVARRNLYVSVAGPRADIYHSPDGGQTFTAPDLNNLPPDLDVRTLTVDGSNPQTVYVGTAYVANRIAPDWDRVKLSTDGGKTWRDAGPWSPDSTDGPDAHQPISLLLYASGSGGLYAGNGDQLWRLAPDNSGWQTVESGLPANGVYGLAADPQIPGLLYAATRDGFYRNSDGQTWQKLASGEVGPLFASDPGQAQLSVQPGLIAVATSKQANSSQGLHSTFLYALSNEGQLARYENRDFDPELVANVPGANNLPDFGPYGGTNPVEPVAGPVEGGTPDPNKLFVKETGHYVQGDFKDVWTDPTKNSPFFYGNPLSEQFQEYDYSSKITKTVQFFERVKFESTRPNEVKLAPLGREAVEGKFFPPGRFIQTTAVQQYFAETKHTLRGAFFEFYQKNGALGRFGFPLSEEFTDKTGDGKDVVYQYFERVKLSFDPATGKVTIAPLGMEVLQKRGWAKT